MGLLRAAFERQDGIIEIVVLCTGCHAEMVERLAGRRRWCRPLDTGYCEFCAEEARSAALR